MISARDAIIRLAGMVDLVGDEPPTKEQWAKIQVTLAEAYVDVATEKMIGNPLVRGYEDRPKYLSQSPAVSSEWSNKAYGVTP